MVSLKAVPAVWVVGVGIEKLAAEAGPTVTDRPEPLVMVPSLTTIELVTAL